MMTTDDLNLANRNVAPAIAGFRQIDDLRNRDLRPGDRFILSEVAAPMGDRTGPTLYGVAEVLTNSRTNRRRTFSGEVEYRLTYRLVSGNLRTHRWSGAMTIAGNDRDRAFRRPVRCEVTPSHGASLLPSGWGYRSYEQRDYSDGLRVLLEWSDQTIASANGFTSGDRPIRCAATVWVAADGVSGGFHRRRIDTTADLSALVAGFRRALVSAGMYPLYSDDGARRAPTSERPALVSRETRVLNLKSGY